MNSHEFPTDPHIFPYKPTKWLWKAESLMTIYHFFEPHEYYSDLGITLVISTINHRIHSAIYPLVNVYIAMENHHF